MSLKSLTALFIFTASVLPLYSQLIVQKDPSTIIKGHNSCPKRPEGIAFSPSGDCFAVACPGSDSISFYNRIKSTRSNYQSFPDFVIQNSKLLSFAHDVDFSLCGKYIAVACREANKVVIFKMNNLEINNTPHCILNSQSSHIDNPASVSFSPCGEVLAVCNRTGGSGITFYKQIENKKGKYHPTPFYELTEQKLLEYRLSAPHGIAFSPDGKSLGVVHKRYFKNKEAIGESALAIFDRVDDPVEGMRYILSYVNFQGQASLHSIDFHPSGDHLATVDEQFVVRIYSKNKQSQYVQSSEIPIVIPKICLEGPKGIAFSPDGKRLAITTMEPSVQIYEIKTW